MDHGVEAKFRGNEATATRTLITVSLGSIEVLVSFGGRGGSLFARGQNGNDGRTTACAVFPFVRSQTIVVRLRKLKAFHEPRRLRDAIIGLSSPLLVSSFSLYIYLVRFGLRNGLSSGLKEIGGRQGSADGGSLIPGNPRKSPRRAITFILGSHFPTFGSDPEIRRGGVPSYVR